MNRNYVFLSLFLFLGANTVVLAQREDSVFVNGETLASLLRKADNGDVYSLCRLVRAYRRGDVIKPDYEKAMKYASMAEAQEPVVLYHMAVLYENNYGVEKDTVRSRQCYDRFYQETVGNSERLRLDEYQIALANVYNYDKKYKDTKRAKEWYAKAAKQGNDLAMVAVARSFTYDSGNVNIDSAIYWYSKILQENKNHTTALNNLGVIYYEKNDTTRALEYYKKGGAAGNARSYDNLGDHYYIHKQFDRAIAYYHKAAEIGIPEYQVQLGRFYENGFLVKRDYQKAIYWYNEAARQYENDARYRLAWMYYAGLGVKKDIVKAKGLLQSAKAYSSDAAVFYDLIKD